MSKKPSAKLLPLALVPIMLWTAPLTANIAEVNSNPDQSGCFYAYFSAARLLDSGEGRWIYNSDKLSAEQRELRPKVSKSLFTQFFGPPPSIPFLTPLGLLDSRIAAWLWTILLMLSTAGSAWALSAAFELTLLQGVMVGTLLVLAGPYAAGVRMGQPVPILLSTFSIALILLKRQRLWGAAFALTTLVLKPQWLIPLIYLGATGRPQHSLAGGNTYRLLVPNFAANHWLEWLGRLHASGQEDDYQPAIDMSRESCYLHRANFPVDASSGPDGFDKLGRWFCMEQLFCSLLFGLEI